LYESEISFIDLYNPNKINFTDDKKKRKKIILKFYYTHKKFIEYVKDLKRLR